MPHVGVPELIVVLMILVLVFGGSRLPQIGEGMGKAIRSFKRGLSSDDAIEVTAPKAAPGAGSSKSAGEGAAGKATDAELVEKS